MILFVLKTSVKLSACLIEIQIESIMKISSFLFSMSTCNSNGVVFLPNRVGERFPSCKCFYFYFIHNYICLLVTVSFFTIGANLFIYAPLVRLFLHFGCINAPFFTFIYKSSNGLFTFSKLFWDTWV